MTFTGLHLPLITPFTTTGALAEDALERLAHTVVDDGADGIVALGTTAEASSLTADERARVLEICAAVCAERAVPLTVGVESASTASTAEALAALDRRATAALVPVPAFVRPSEEGVIAHFTALTAAAPVPLIIYHIPYRTARPLSAGTLLSLAAIPGVAGFKHAAGGIDDATITFMADRPDRTAVLAGDDRFASPLLALGASGAILASAHLATARFARLVALWRAGQADAARALGHRLAALSDALFAEPNPVVIKAVLAEQGRIPSRAVRLPLLPATPEATGTALQRAS
ncbi:4-hydroxy-tetrahydrodipicolinate synthase [Actinocorallia herbida]|uniref:4-hydroxy-tetrahydrodipicolinate synthase n=1 Tax=Actinocorallia herbida TaxID=58109 RepID=A0A3N1CU60_9ACTN|nr:dihydrodipicolinate synthase family protein [Actinocorallia herbida]ROO84843.1 4-hydroxy-tetrahydrodipicolinate synthase [Actinocorallia herbida]